MHIIQTNHVGFQCTASIEEAIFTNDLRQLTSAIHGAWPKPLNATHNKIYLASERIASLILGSEDCRVLVINNGGLCAVQDLGGF